jgi:clan AA aspartic protease (TIGR02281 family)
MSSAFARSITVLLLLSAGFSAGWWMRGINNVPPELVSATPSAAPQVPSAPQLGKPTAVQTTAPVQAQSAQPQSAQSSLAAPSAQSAAEAAPAEQDSRTQFQALLNAGEYDAAMDFYVEVERASREEALSLKSDVIKRLETALGEDNRYVLTGLIDAFLSRYYDDIDVLLLLARHQQRSDYLTEAAHTFQLAFTYAYSSGEQQQVQRAFSAFVGETDDFLSRQGRWQTLINLYETLALLELSQPRYRLRQAELYLNQGEPHFGRELLRRLAKEPAVASQAEALLASTHPQPAAASAGELQDSIALNMTGSHYHLPLRLNGSVDVELIIDTGATTTTMSKSTFATVRRQSRFVELGPQVFNTANGAVKGTVYRVERVQLGKHVLSDVHIAVLDFEMPPGVDGLLGMNILRNFRFQVDQDEQRLYLRPRRG